MPELTHISLFTGIGGLDLAAEWAGFRTVGQCEWADYPRAVLEKHWPTVPKWRDIHNLTAKDFFDKTGCPPGGVTCLSGGFPCQPFSQAGKRRGKDDDRYLWPEMLRVIQEIRPRWVVGENVGGFVSMALDTVLSDLESIGYTCQAIVFPACAVDAPHRRDRCAILAHTNSTRPQGYQQHGTPDASGRRQESHRAACQCGEIVPDTNSTGLPVPRYEPGFKTVQPKDGTALCGWWPAEPDVGRVAHGVPKRVDRLKCLGNAVVPWQFYPIFKAIAELEAMNEHSVKC